MLICSLALATAAAAQGAPSCEDEADRTAFLDARSADTRLSYSVYLDNFPFGCFAPQARSLEAGRADEEAWRQARETNTIAAYRFYRDTVPDGRFLAEALAAMESLQSQPAVGTLNPLASFRLQGRALATSLLSDATACEMECAGDARCQGFTFQAQLGLCSRFSEIARAEFDRDASSGSRVDVELNYPEPVLPEPVPAPQPTPQPVPQPQIQPAPEPVVPTRQAFEVFNVTDLPGNDLRTLFDISVLDCQQACSQDRICQGYTYNIPNNVCFLKSAAGRREYHIDAYSAVKQ